MDRLERILEKMATQAPPTVNVNVVLPDSKKRKQTDPDAAINDPANDGSPVGPSQQPHPYVS